MKEKINYHIIRDSKSAAQIIRLIDKVQPDLVAFDIETNGVIEHECKTIGIAFTWDTSEGFYFTLSEYDQTRQKLVNLYSPAMEHKIVTTLCKALSKSNLVMHNGVFDIACLYHAYGIDLTSSLYSDTLLMKHTIDEEPPFGLKDLGEMAFGEAAKDEQQDLVDSVLKAGGKWNKTNKDMYMGDPELIAKYAIKDAVLTAKLFEILDDELQTQGLSSFFYDQEVMPLYRKATIPMKLAGVHIDEAYFKKLKKEVEDGIIELTDKVFEIIAPKIEPKIKEILDKAVATSKIGQFAEGLLKLHNIPLPTNKRTGKPTLAKTALKQLEAQYPAEKALKWLLWEPKLVEVEVKEPKLDSEGNEIYNDEGELEVTLVKKLIPDPKEECPYPLKEEDVYAVKKEIYIQRFPHLPRIFNLSSTQHLGWLVFEAYGEEAVKFSRKTGAPQVNKDALENLDLPFIPTLLQLKKEEKLLSTYIDPILSIHKNGKIYPSLMQFGTTSGRYSCGGGLNLQTLPRDDKRIKKGFIAPPGYKIVNSDFSSLEPRIFTYVSGDEGLKRVYREGLDLYSQVAIDLFELDEVSARKGDSNFLGEIDPDKRQLIKQIVLAIPYGANAGRISSMLKIEYTEAMEIINKYLDAYPGLKEYMKTQEQNVIRTGIVYTDFGRIRHLYDAKDLYDQFGTKLYNKKRMMLELGEKEGTEIYYRFRTALNNAKNFPIQGTAAHVCNAAMIKMADLIDQHQIDAKIVLMVHDEITCLVKEEHAELAVNLLRDAMQNNEITNKIDIPILAEPVIADNFAESK